MRGFQEDRIKDPSQEPKIVTPPKTNIEAENHPKMKSGKSSEPNFHDLGWNCQEVFGGVPENYFFFNRDLLFQCFIVSCSILVGQNFNIQQDAFIFFSLGIPMNLHFPMLLGDA